MMNEIDRINPSDHYELLSLLGEGSRARIYLANDTKGGGKVAIKFLKEGEDNFPKNEDALAHLNHEATCLGLSAHANVAAKIGAFTSEAGRPYMVMEYAKGRSLRQMMAAGALPPDPTLIVNMFIQLTHAIENMHKVGVLHMDLRPDKILIEESDKVPNPKLIGFGRGRFLPWAAREQTVEPPPKADYYSLQYASPEQINDKRCLPTSDLYSFGCVMYEALTGKPPVQGENELHLLAQHLSGVVQPVSAIKGDAYKKYDEVILQMLAKETPKRYVDFAELRENLQRVNAPAPSGNWMTKLFKR